MEGLKSFARTLAKNDLLINGLFDVQGQGSYLPAFFHSLNPPASSSGQVSLVDYKGRVVVSNVHKDEATPTIVLKESIDVDQYELKVCEPISYSGSIEGGVVLRYSAASFE